MEKTPDRPTSPAGAAARAAETAAGRPKRARTAGRSRISWMLRQQPYGRGRDALARGTTTAQQRTRTTVWDSGRASVGTRAERWSGGGQGGTARRPGGRAWAATGAARNCRSRMSWREKTRKHSVRQAQQRRSEFLGRRGWQRVSVFIASPAELISLVGAAAQHLTRWGMDRPTAWQRRRAPRPAADRTRHQRFRGRARRGPCRPFADLPRLSARRVGVGRRQGGHHLTAATGLARKELPGSAGLAGPARRLGGPTLHTFFASRYAARFFLLGLDSTKPVSRLRPGNPHHRLNPLSVRRASPPPCLPSQLMCWMRRRPLRS